MILKKEMICARISVFFGKHWNTFFDYKSWIRILNMKLEFEQIETLGIRSQRKTAKKNPINNKIQENKYICYITL